MEVWAIRILSLEHDYKEITLPWQRKEKSGQRTVRNLPAKEDLYLLLCVFMIPIAIIIYTNILAYVRQHRTY
jgi:hypothetical protein